MNTNGELGQYHRSSRSVALKRVKVMTISLLLQFKSIIAHSRFTLAYIGVLRNVITSEGTSAKEKFIRIIHNRNRIG